MSDNSAIEWTDATWNPVTGCTKVSPGCDNCYADTFSERWRGIAGHYFENGFDIQLRPDKLTVPLTWKKPRRVFVNSMSDLFHKDIPDEYIAKVFAVMGATPQHTYQLLTKRHGRMRSLLNNGAFRLMCEDEWSNLIADESTPLSRNQRERKLTQWWSDFSAKPLPNVWLGVSVEDQKHADLRIPALLETPAAVRFLSCEPLLGPVDLATWMPPISPVPVAKAPRTWAEWTWPGWVPTAVRSAVEGFWGADQGRTPRDWMRDMHQQGAPAFGSTLRMKDGFSTNPPYVTGRYVHAWNNIGRLVLDGDPDREFAYTSFSSTERRQAQGLDWVIVGGESGRGARPMDSAWATQIVQQCQQSNVPVFVKQLGSRWGKQHKEIEQYPADLRVREVPPAPAPAVP